MSNLKIIFNKQQLIQLYDLFHEYYLENDARKILGNILNKGYIKRKNIDKSLYQFDCFDNYLIKYFTQEEYIKLNAITDNDTLVEKKVRLLPDDIEFILEKAPIHCFFDIYNYAPEILLDYFQEKENLLSVLPSIEEFTLNYSYLIDFSVYYLLIENNLIELDIEKNRNIFNKIALKTINSKFTPYDHKKKEVNKIYSNALIYFFKINKNENDRKEFYCQFLENNLILDLKNPEVVAIYSEYSTSDFSDYVNKYLVIRDFYNENKIKIKELTATIFSFDHSQQAKNYDINVEDYKKILNLATDFFQNISKANLEIDSTFKDSNNSQTKFNIFYYEKTKNIELLKEQYLTFIHLLLIEFEDPAEIEKKLIKTWEKSQFLEKLNQNLPNKKIINKKKL